MTATVEPRATESVGHATSVSPPPDAPGSGPDSAAAVTWESPSPGAYTRGLMGPWPLLL